jgi:hypothetical protein
METLCSWRVLYNDVVQWLDEHLEEACYWLVVGVVARTEMAFMYYNLPIKPMALSYGLSK